MYIRNSIPRPFDKYIDTEYTFKLQDCIPTKEIEVKKKSFRIAYFDGNKSHQLGGEYYLTVPESLYVRLTDPQDVQYLISKQRNRKVYVAGTLFRESTLMGNRVQKYMTLFKAYESLTKPSDRNIYYSSIRHSLSHSVTSLTKLQVINSLNEMFGGLEVDLAQFKHKKVFFINYWKMLIEVDKMIYQQIEELLPEAKELISGLHIIR